MNIFYEFSPVVFDTMRKYGFVEAANAYCRHPGDFARMDVLEWVWSEYDKDRQARIMGEAQ